MKIQPIDHAAELRRIASELRVGQPVCDQYTINQIREAADAIDRHAKAFLAVAARVRMAYIQAHSAQVHLQVAQDDIKPFIPKRDDA